MAHHATLGNRLFAARDALEDGHALLHQLVGFDVHEIGAWQTVLSDEDWPLVAFDVGQKFRRLPFQLVASSVRMK